MSHFVRERADQDWYRGLKVPETVILNIDEKTKKAVSGTGGTYAPASAIVLGGAGLELQCRLDLGGAGALAQPAPGRNFEFGDDDFFRYETPLSKTIDDPPFLWLDNWSVPRNQWIDQFANFGIVLEVICPRPNSFLRCPIRVPDGAVLASVEVTFRVTATYAAVPAKLVRARVVRISADGTLEKHPYLTSTGDADGWVSPARPASGAAWKAAAALQTFTLSFNSASGPRADRRTYDYFLEFQSEGGTNANADAVFGNQLVHVRTTVKLLEIRPYY